MRILVVKIYLLALVSACAGPQSESGPSSRANAGEGLAKEVVADADGDGVAAAADACPEAPEDIDGFQDEDGCPDTDNDRDGVPDVEDKCPNDASHRSRPRDARDDESLGCPLGERQFRDGPPGDLDNDGYPDAEDACPTYAETFPSRLDGGCTDDGDGCPDGQSILLVDCSIAIFELVHFSSRSSELTPQARAVLLALTATFASHGELEVEVVGHVDDSEGTSTALARAAAVHAALVAGGVEAGRLTTRNAAAGEPLKATDALRGRELRNARASNRRVSFVITRAPRLPGRPIEPTQLDNE